MRRGVCLRGRGGPLNTYGSPFTISANGTHTIQFGSFDRTGNIESPRPTQTIKIDSTAPTMTCTPNTRTLWPPNGKQANVTVSGTITDTVSGLNAGTVAFAVTDEYGQVQPKGTLSVVGGSGAYSLPISLVANRNDNDQDGRKYTITITGNDNAGNMGTCSTVVTVPHDQGQ